MNTPTQSWPASSWIAWATICKTPPVRSRSALSGGPCCVGGTRSQPGTGGRVSNGPTEAANNLIKRVKRVAFGLTRFRNFRIRVLLYAGRPNWDLLATVAPR